MALKSLFEKKSQAKISASYTDNGYDAADINIPDVFLRQNPLSLACCSELEVVRHFTNLSRRNFSIDTHFYPLGSCTMKYNPRAIHGLATLPKFLNLHPLQSVASQQPILKMLYDLQQNIALITGMKAVSLAPMAGAQGEWVGVAMIKAYHQGRGDERRCEMLVPTAAHGTNPASAVMCGYKVIEIATDKNGDIDLDDLQQKLGPSTAGVMLTNPSTLGVFERNITTIAAMVHDAGGLLYYDGANLNAVLGRFCPGDMGFDVMHLNCHKTFATPHGGGGPGAGPVAAAETLAPYLPWPMVGCEVGANDSLDKFFWRNQDDCPDSIGRVTSFYGNVGVLLRAHWYLQMLGQEGLPRVSAMALLNAQYCQEKLRDIGYSLAFPARRASHEFLITLQPLTKKYNVTALDVAKRLLDLGFHAPTIYFPLQVPECLLIEPTETESLAQLDSFLEAMQIIYNEIHNDAEKLRLAPQLQSVQRLDEVRAARELDLRYQSLAKDCLDISPHDQS